MNEAIKNDQAQTCPQCGRGRKYFGVADSGHEQGGCCGHGHHDHNNGKHHKHEGHGK